MAENFLSNDESIQGKWGPPPKLDAPNIAGTLAAILNDKLQRQKMLSADVAGTIKNVMADRQRQAYAEALRNTGLSEGQDLSGVGDADQTRIAQMLLQRTPNDVEDNYKKALTDEAKARAGMYSKYGTGGGGSDDSEPETYTDENNVTWRKHYDAKGRVNWYPIKSPTAAKPQTQGDLKSELANTGVTMEGLTNSSGQRGFLPSGSPVPSDRPWTDASTIQVPGENGPVPLTIEKFRHLKKALGIPDPDPTPMPSRTPSPNPDVTVGPLTTPSGSPIPTATPRATTPTPSDQAGGHADNYGVVMTQQDKEAVAWARTHSGDPRAAAILNRLGIQ